MIVIDATTALAALLNNGRSRELLVSERVCAPDSVDAGVVHGLRQLAQNRRVTASTAHAALDTWRRLGIRRCPTRPLLPRVWELIDTLDTGPAVSAALAERLDVAWVTADLGAGAGAPVVRCPITVIPN